MKSILGYHFTASFLRDGRPIPPIGETLVHIGEIIPCARGLHASEDLFDALKYAPGTMLHRVRLSGRILSHGDPIDKFIGSERTILASFEAKAVLRRFAKDCALSVIDLWEAPDAVREFLESEEASKLDTYAAAYAASYAYAAYAHAAAPSSASSAAASYAYAYYADTYTYAYAAPSFAYIHAVKASKHSLINAEALQKVKENFQSLIDKNLKF